VSVQTYVESPDQSRVIQVGEQPPLGQELVAASLFGDELPSRQLEHQRPSELGVDDAINVGLPPGADFADDRIAADRRGAARGRLRDRRYDGFGRPHGCRSRQGPQLDHFAAEQFFAQAALFASRDVLAHGRRDRFAGCQGQQLFISGALRFSRVSHPRRTGWKTCPTHK